MRGPVDPWRRVEAGSLSDYANWSAQDPSFAAAGADIVSQLQAEGATQTAIEGAKSAFGKAVDDFSQMGIQIGDPVGAGKSYVLNAYTIAGAVNTVEGLASAVQSGSPVQLTQAFTGVMIGLAVAAGIFSAGVGAAIVAGASGLMSALGPLFASNPGVGICQGVNARSQPDLVAGCLAGFVDASGVAVVPPGDQADWRTFPAKTKLGDAPWYMGCGNGGCGEFSWGGVTWSNKLTANPPGPMRPIDYAFGAFSIGCEPYLTAPIGPPGFTDGWCAAWKSNAEYALNGLKPQEDPMVLAHYVRMWNIAHAPSPVVPFSTIAQPHTYLQALTARARTFVLNQETDFFGPNDLAINAGPAHAAPRRTIHLSILPANVVRLNVASLAADRAAAPAHSAATGAGSALALGALALGGLLLWKPALLRKLGVRL